MKKSAEARHGGRVKNNSAHAGRGHNRPRPAKLPVSDKRIWVLEGWDAISGDTRYRYGASCGGSHWMRHIQDADQYRFRFTAWVAWLRLGRRRHAWRVTEYREAASQYRRATV